MHSGGHQERLQSEEMSKLGLKYKDDFSGPGGWSIFRPPESLWMYASSMPMVIVLDSSLNWNHSTIMLGLCSEAGSRGEKEAL